MGTLGIFQIKKSIFLKVADIVRKIDIWPENDILGVLEWFGTLIRYLESSRTDFEKIEKIAFFGFLTCGSPLCPGRNFGRSAGNRTNDVANPSGHL